MLVKALPHVGKSHGEIVCCAGVTEGLEWRRQFPIRFRHLRDNKFRRWQWIEYDWRRSRSDQRLESRRVREETIRPGDYMPQAARADFLAPIVLECVDEAVENNQTLALIRPEKSEFRYKRKSKSEIESEK